MNRPDFVDQMLAVDETFRVRMLQQTLSAARQRRLKRRAVRVGFASLILLLIVQVFQKQSYRSEKHQWAADAPWIIRSQPLQEGEMVTTVRDQIVVVGTKGTTVSVVQTSLGQYTNLDDNGLMALLTGHPAVLLRKAADKVELLFVNEGDVHGFPLN